MIGFSIIIVLIVILIILCRWKRNKEAKHYGFPYTRRKE
jgi:hypothetical protein